MFAEQNSALQKERKREFTEINKKKRRMEKRRRFFPFLLPDSLKSFRNEPTSPTVIRFTCKAYMRYRPTITPRWYFQYRVVALKRRLWTFWNTQQSVTVISMQVCICLWSTILSYSKKNKKRAKNRLCFWSAMIQTQHTIHGVVRLFYQLFLSRLLRW